MEQESTAQLEGIARWYDDPNGLLQGWESIHRHLVRYRYLSMQDLVRGHNIIELGIADGEMTRYFLRDCTSVCGVEGAAHFIARCRDKFPEALASKKLTLHASLFENYRPTQRAPVVVASHVLEHLAAPVEALRHFARCMAPGGILLVSVPNALSLHRQVAVKMGLLPRADSLNAQDVQLGHQRVYTPALLREHAAAAGLQVQALRGILLKPLANRQMEHHWSQAQLDGFFELGKDLPELCAELLIVCSQAQV